MAVTIHASGDAVCVAATPLSLVTSPETTAGAFQLVLDLNPLTATQNLEIRIKEKARNAAGTQRVVWYDIASGIQGVEKIWVSPVLMLLNGWDMEITSNSTPTIPWSIRKA